MVNSVNYGPTQTGNGGTLSFPISALDTTTTFKFYCTFTPVSCDVYLYEQVTIHVTTPHAYWTINNFNPEVGQSLRILNNSVAQGVGTYHWTFGAGASPAFYNDSLPSSLTFNSTGIYYVKLKVDGALGCFDSLIRAVHVIAPFTMSDSCSHSNITADSLCSPLVTAIDYYPNNEFCLFLNDASNQNCNYETFSNQGDTLQLSNLNDPGNQIGKIIKYTNKSIAQWHATINRSTGGAGVSVYSISHDDDGNIYLAFKMNSSAGTVQIISSNGLPTDFYAPSTGNSSIWKIFICKIDSMGIAQWINYFNDDYTTNKIHLEIDGNMNVYVSGLYKLVKFSTAGQLLWEHGGNFCELNLDTNGEVWTASSTNFGVNHYSTLGFVIDSIPQMILPIGNTEIKYFHRHNSSFYFSGKYFGTIFFAGDTLSTTNSFGNLFIGKINSSGQPLWIREFKSGASLFVKGLDISGNTLSIIAGNSATDSVQSENCTSIFFTHLGCFIFHSDTNNLQGNLIKLYDASINGWSPFTTITSNPLLHLNNDNFITSFRYHDTFYLSDTIKRHPLKSNIVILRQSFSCIDSLNFSMYVPHSQCSQIDGCVTGTYHPIDFSTNTPIAWHWTFPGGVPAFSNLQFPAVQYFTSGVHTIYLTAENVYGVGDTGQVSFMVDSLPAVSLAFSDTIICEGAGPVLLIGNPPGGVYMGAGIAGNTFDPAGLFAGDYQISYNYAGSNPCSNTATNWITIVPCTATFELANENNFNLCPNPFSTQFTLELKNTSIISIYNLIGEKLIDKKNASGTVTLGDELSSGMYILEMKNESGRTAVLKMVKVN